VAILVYCTPTAENIHVSRDLLHCISTNLVDLTDRAMEALWRTPGLGSSKGSKTSPYCPSWASHQVAGSITEAPTKDYLLSRVLALPAAKRVFCATLHIAMLPSCQDYRSTSGTPYIGGVQGSETDMCIRRFLSLAHLTCLPPSVHEHPWLLPAISRLEANEPIVDRFLDIITTKPNQTSKFCVE
jgi:hypothetical protein